jgi:alpha-beta hydrolase superfamily lysophospholipase
VFTVYEYDRRGRGDSGEADPYAVEREVEDLAAVIGAAGGPAFAFGHSSGGALVLEAAASGVPVRGLAVYEPPYIEGPTYEFADQLAELAAAGRDSDVAAAFLTLMGTPAAVLEQMKAGPYWQHMTAYSHTLAYEVRLCHDGRIPLDRLAKISAPALALAGGASPAWAQEGARAIAASVQHDPARPVPDLGLIGVGAVRAARDAGPQPDGACGLATGPGPVFAVVLTLPAVISAVAAPIPIRIHERFGAPSRDERTDMHRCVGVVDTLLVLVHGSP